MYIFMFLVAANIMCSFTPVACKFYSVDSSWVAFALFCFPVNVLCEGSVRIPLERFYTIVFFFEKIMYLFVCLINYLFIMNTVHCMHI